MTTPSAPAGDAALLGGRYRLLGLLGSGGMGSVYRALDVELDEIVALKTLRHEHLDSADALARFRREAKLARRVTHRNVARTFDIGEHEGQKFLTMEHVDGESLAALLTREGALSPRRAAEIAREICAGLAAAHAAGVIHRDLKPANVLLAKDGRVVITDFGISRAFTSDAAGGTEAGVLIGTPHYMAPEQVQAMTDLDERVDIYALGVLLYELLTGTRAWTGNGPLMVAAARLYEDPPDPRERRPEIPEDLARLVLACMAREREQRPARAVEVGTSLERTIDVAPAVTVARPAPAPAARTVAVLPFRNSGAPEDEYLADGLTDDLIDSLSMSPGLRTRPRGVVMRFKGKDLDPREVGRELAVDIVVDGSIRKMGSTLRLAARMLGVADGFQLWALRSDCTASELLVTGDRMATAIAEALTGSRGAPERAAITDSAAIDLYLRARFELRRGWNDDPTPALQLFDQALARAPDDPSILAGAALAHARSLFFARASSADRARELAERAVKVGPGFGEAWVALTLVHLNTSDTAGAVRALRSGLVRAPRLARLEEMLGRILVEVGRPAEGVPRLETALLLDPTEEAPRWDLVRVAALAGDWARVDDLLARPIFDAANLPVATMWRARFALWRPSPPPVGPVDGDDDPAAPLTFGRIFRRTLARGTLAPAEDEHMEQMAVTRGPRMRPLIRQMHAELLGFTGAGDRCVDAVERAVAAGLIDRLWFDGCPLLAQARASSRWVGVRARFHEQLAPIYAALDAPGSDVLKAPTLR